MNAKTHETGGLLFAGAALCITGETELAAGAVGVCSAMIGALAPDLDHAQAKATVSSPIGRGLHFLTQLLPNGAGSHRRFWHSPAGCAVFAVCWWLLLTFFTGLISGWIKHKTGIDITGYTLYSTVYFFIGAISHLVFDCFNKQSVPLFFPVIPDTHRKFPYVFGKKGWDGQGAQGVPVLAFSMGDITGELKEKVFCYIWLFTAIILLYLWLVNTQNTLDMPDVISEILKKIM